MKSAKSMGRATGSLGGLDNQDIPGLIVQMLVSIGVDESIVPLDYEDPYLGNLWTCILESGFLVLDLHFTLNRREIDIS